ncbi:YgaP family membrane protein [Sediminibacterium ginsengisoli]|uniref:Inner membrane protein YgaP-like transmembrane domain-containing protein n=1 Tax=Sediminibacterium ginsengisoli TaxID=413434 RepID=A0A1T4KU81_9BACT|nr:DUF2892 domain-containing protein [Sediminibacterium ginsengisoli]SJZ45920.1 Protein of unknown function [Sediminibacterium ginsengisoli]
MKKNIGAADKIIRILIAVAIGVSYLTGLISGNLAVVFIVLAVILLVTSFINFCPAYFVLGINTKK